MKIEKQISKHKVFLKVEHETIAQTEKSLEKSCFALKLVEETIKLVLIKL